VLLSVVAVSTAMVLLVVPILSVSRTNRSYDSSVEVFGTVCYQLALHEQNGVLATDTIVLQRAIALEEAVE
jgi:hypothetical protein